MVSAMAELDANSNLQRCKSKGRFSVWGLKIRVAIIDGLMDMIAHICEGAICPHHG